MNPTDTSNPHPTKTRRAYQVEQDIWLERLIAQMARHPVLSQRLALSGGTGLHKLWLPSPLRYSEVLDYVCLTGNAHTLLDDVRDHMILSGLSRERRSVRRNSPFPKAWGAFRSVADGRSYRIKVELADPHPSLPLDDHVRYITTELKAPGASGSLALFAMSPAYTGAMKFQAIYSRAKGRDLFDFYHCLTTLGITLEDVADLLEHAKLNNPYFLKWGLVSNMQTMGRHLARNSKFLTDLEVAVPGWYGTAEFQRAVEMHAEFAESVHREMQERKAYRRRYRQAYGHHMDASWTTNVTRPLPPPARPKRNKYDPQRAQELKRAGLTNAQIAERMGVSASWAQRHTAGIRERH